MVLMRPVWRTPQPHPSLALSQQGAAEAHVTRPRRVRRSSRVGRGGAVAWDAEEQSRGTRLLLVSMRSVRRAPQPQPFLALSQ